MAGISRILIANRGEIAACIINACRALGVESVLAVSDVHRESMAAQMADRVVCIGPSPAQESYLKAVPEVASGRNLELVMGPAGLLTRSRRWIG